MSRSHRISLLLIAASLLLLSPINIANMAWNHITMLALREIYSGVFSWLLILLAGMAIIVAIVAEDHRNPPQI